MSILDTIHVSEPDDSNENTPKRSIADKLVDIAADRFEFNTSLEGDAFALPIAGPRVPLMLRGGGSLRGALAAAYLKDHGKAPTSQGLADAMLVLEGFALDADPVPLFQRVARIDDTVVIDLGRPGSAACIVITPEGWAVTDTPPAGVLFRRSKLTAPLPLPALPGDLGALRRLLHVDDSGWALIVGWLVAAFIADLPHPVLRLGGEQGASKSTTAKMLLGLIDPSPAPLRRSPRDDEELLHYMRTSHALAIDNVSAIPLWLSDALCRASTGDGIVKRQLYTDSDIVVYAFRRCVILTGIAVSAVQGDLIDRLVSVDLERIDEEHRRLDSAVTAEYEAVRPQVFAALLTMVSSVLRVAPQVKLSGLPRMADYAHILACIDDVYDLGAFDSYMRMYDTAFEDAIDGNLVAHAVVEFMTGRTEWTGTASELHEMMTPSMPPKGWPRTVHHFGNDLTRAQTILRAAGLEFARSRRAGGVREITLTRTR